MFRSPKLVLLASVLAMCIAVPASAASLPTFCTSPTAEQRADTALMDECKLLAEVDASVAQLTQVIATVGQTLDSVDKSIKTIDENINQQLKKK